MEIKELIAGPVANRVSMCVISPAVLIVLMGMAGDRVLHISENFAMTAVTACCALFFISSVCTDYHRNRHQKIFFPSFSTEFPADGRRSAPAKRACRFSLFFK